MKRAAWLLVLAGAGFVAEAVGVTWLLAVLAIVYFTVWGLVVLATCWESR